MYCLINKKNLIRVFISVFSHLFFNKSILRWLRKTKIDIIKVPSIFLLSI